MGGDVSCFMTETLWSVSVAPRCCYIALAAVYSVLHLQGGRQLRTTRKGEKKRKMRVYSCRLFCSVTSSSGILQSVISKNKKKEMICFCSVLLFILLPGIP